MASTSPASDPAPSWAWWLATGFGSGRLPGMPGTWGSLAALAFGLLLTWSWATPLMNWARLHPGNRYLPWLALGGEGVFLALILLLTWLSVRASDLVTREVGLKDPSWIVADEWVGMWIALWPMRWLVASEPYRFFGPAAWRWWLLLLLPFALFRVLDILKPWPIRPLQDLPGGQGVVADDVVAGLLALPLVVLLQPHLLRWLGL